MDWMRLINWKTTSCAIGMLVCWVTGKLMPEFDVYCELLDKLFTAGIGVAGADALRVQNIVNTVDHLMKEMKSTLLNSAPAEPIIVPAIAVKPHE